eukprot:1896239-Rhodomonas_salina.1
MPAYRKRIQRRYLTRRRQIAGRCAPAWYLPYPAGVQRGPGSTIRRLSAAFGTKMRHSTNFGTRMRVAAAWYGFRYAGT